MWSVRKELGRKYLKIHMRLHTGEKLTTCECHNKTFISKSHYKNFHDYHKYHAKHTCATCNEKFKTRIDLNLHQRVHFSEPPRFNCSVCKKGFLELHKYRQHMYSHVPRILKACKYEHCGRSYIYKKHLIAHYKQHFITNWNLVHLTIIKLDNFTIYIC